MMFAQHLKRALVDIRAHGFLNAATIVTVSLAVLIVSAALLFFVNTRGTLDAWQQQARIMAYLTTKAGSAVSSLTQAIEGIDGVRRARFIPQAEILQELKDQMPNQASLFEHLEENPLPDAFEIELKPTALSWEQIDRIAERVGSLRGIETVEYGRQWAATLRGIVHVLGTVGAAIIGLFVLAAVTIIASTVRLVVHARQDEVEIMRLVGAAEWFIKAPFYITGLIQGFVGGCVGLGALFVLFDRVMESIEPAAWAGVLTIRFLSLEEMAMIITGSMLVGWWGAFISLGQRLDRTVIHGIIIMVLFMSAAAANATDDVGPPAAAADPSLDSLRQEAQELQRDIHERKAEIDRMARREGDATAALEAAARALHRCRQQALAAKAELEQLERKITSTRTAEQDLMHRIRANETYLSKRLLALYTSRRIGSVNGWASSASIVEAVKRKAALERIVSHDETVQRSLTAYSDELRELRRLLLQQEEELRSRAADYERKLAVVNREQSRREELLSRIRTERMAQINVLETLQEATRLLERQILARDRSHDGRDERAQSPAQPITASKGLLIFPVKGKIANFYGPYRHPRLNAPGFRNGIDIAAERGEPVLAVHGGTIIYSSWFIGYGNVVIIDHGDHFYSVYAHLEDVFKSVDNRVQAGDVIATTGDSGAMGSTGLYFELRHHDRALNPLEWLKQG